MKTIDIEEMRADFERLIEQAAAGQALVISKDGKRLVIVRPVGGRVQLRAGEFGVPDDYDEVGREEIEGMFYGAERRMVRSVGRAESQSWVPAFAGVTKGVNKPGLGKSWARRVGR